jgi:hypothetical protein
MIEVGLTMLGNVSSDLARIVVALVNLRVSCPRTLSGLAARPQTPLGGYHLHLNLHHLFRHQRKRSHWIPPATSFSEQPFLHSL